MGKKSWVRGDGKKGRTGSASVSTAEMQLGLTLHFYAAFMKSLRGPTAISSSVKSAILQFVDAAQLQGFRSNCNSLRPFRSRFAKKSR